MESPHLGGLFPFYWIAKGGGKNEKIRRHWYGIEQVNHRNTLNISNV